MEIRYIWSSTHCNQTTSSCPVSLNKSHCTASGLCSFFAKRNLPLGQGVEPSSQEGYTRERGDAPVPVTQFNLCWKPDRLRASSQQVPVNHIRRSPQASRRMSTTEYFPVSLNFCLLYRHSTQDTTDVSLPAPFGRQQRLIFAGLPHAVAKPMEVLSWRATPSSQAAWV